MKNRWRARPGWDVDIERVFGVDLGKSANRVVGTLKRRALEHLTEVRAVREEFEARLLFRWGPALNLFDMVLSAAHEAGTDFNRKHRPAAAESNDFVFEVLTRLHARACSVASEVRALLATGHASGAMARWRTIHETAVVGYFIKAQGQDTAERYLLHEVVESLNAAEDYEKCHKRLGYEPLDPSTLPEVKQACNRLCERFGESFRNTYGWAACALAKKAPRLGDIEETVGLDHMRAHYRMSSHGVHSNPKAIMWNIGLLSQKTILLSGASNAGLADPGHASLISLLQCTVVLLTLKPEVDVLITLKALQNLVDEAGDAFRAIHQEQVAEAEEEDEQQ